MSLLKKIPLKFWLILSACIIIFVVSYLRLAVNLEAISYDFRLKLRPALKTSEDIVIIEIDDNSLARLGSWPFPRDAHAAILSFLKSAGARAVFFDILFSDPSVARSELPSGAQGTLAYQTIDLDALFAQAIKESGNVYLPEAFDINTAPLSNFSPPKARGYSASLYEQFKPYIRSSGHMNVFTDPDGKLRRVPLFIQYQNILVPHIALVMACDVLGIDVRKVKLAGRRVIIDEKLSLPVSNNTSFMVNYPDRWAPAYKHFSYAQLIKANNEQYLAGKPSPLLDQFKGKICFIGLTATGTHDRKGMPFEELYPMLGLQASIFNSIIKKQFITDAGPLANSFLNLIAFLVSLFLCFYFPPFKALGRMAIFAVSYFICATGLIFSGLWIDLFLPLLIIAVTYVALTLYKFIEEVHKRQLLEKELDIAAAIQQSFLPKDIQVEPRLKIHSFIQPAKFVAGDLYDVVRLSDDKVGVFIGDVSGKGVPAALIMAQAVSLFRVFARASMDPANVLLNLNKELCQVLQGRFVTALYLVFDTKERLLRSCCAGHLPILITRVTAGETNEVLPAAGPPLGVLDIAEYETFLTTLEKNDRILLYTDGFTEARNKKGEEFGMERLKEAFGTSKGLKADIALSSMTEKLFEFSRGLPQFDDITAILLEYLG
ncbi:MAG: CHASE2 domain-containing protein [Candidatus Omnitrophica bacterium]|nr:CHASE2 domain-containing protein [Candidatus Omnitrophota bacterium]